MLNEEYAIQIARDWNTRDKASGFVGFVTRFEVDDVYVQKFERKIVGAKVHEELWVPSEELEEFNSHIIGQIEVTKVFHSLTYVKERANGGSDELEWIKSLVDGNWKYEKLVSCHEHCDVCMATLCSEHVHSPGYEFKDGYISTVTQEDWEGQVFLCPPCFAVLAENYGLKSS